MLIACKIADKCDLNLNCRLSLKYSDCHTQGNSKTGSVRTIHPSRGRTGVSFGNTFSSSWVWAVWRGIKIKIIKRKLCIDREPISGLPRYNPIHYWSKFCKGVKQGIQLACIRCRMHKKSPNALKYWEFAQKSELSRLWHFSTYHVPITIVSKVNFLLQREHFATFPDKNPETELKTEDWTYTITGYFLYALIPAKLGWKDGSHSTPHLFSSSWVHLHRLRLKVLINHTLYTPHAHLLRTSKQNLGCVLGKFLLGNSILDYFGFWEGES